MNAGKTERTTASYSLLLVVSLASALLTSCQKTKSPSPDNQTTASGPSEAAVHVARHVGDSLLPMPRLVLVYATCTLNKDYLSPYNDNIPFTPNLQKFAADSVVFGAHQTETGLSGTAYASILTGNQADRHGVHRHPVRLPDKMYVMFEAYKELGYETFFWNQHTMASAELNFGQGVKQENTYSKMLTADDPEFATILERLQSDPTYKAFIVTNFSVTHRVYAKTHLEPFLREFPDVVKGIRTEEIASYDALYRKNQFGLSWNFPETAKRLQLSEAEAEKLVRVIELLYQSRVWFLDSLFGDVLSQIESRGLREQSLIAFTADHGELLFRDHAVFQWSHALQLASDILNVPLLISGPGLKPGIYEEVTRSIDLFPTLLGLTGNLVPSARTIQGVDLSPALTEGAPHPVLPAYSHTNVLVQHAFEQMQKANEDGKMRDWALAKRFFPSDDVNLIWVSVRIGDVVSKLRKLDGETWVTETFDLAADPGESTNIFDPDNKLHVEMAKSLPNYKQHLVEQYRRVQSGEAKRRLPESEEIKALKSLGYIK